MTLSAGAACAPPLLHVPATSARVDAIVVPPAAIAEAKTYLRIDNDGEDALIERLIAAAIGHCEAFVGQLLLARTVGETLRAAGVWQMLACRPVRAITAMAAQAGVEAPTPLPVESYGIDIDAGGDGWVRLTTPAAGARIHAEYRAGLAEEWEGIAEPIRQGVIRLASHLYTHRDAADEASPPAAVAALWRPWRRMRLA
jgi:uncharacterized phiE125 gp8 family phage protein